jgi:uncharacterized protein involved in propanediol utilization
MTHTAAKLLDTWSASPASTLVAPALAAPLAPSDQTRRIGYGMARAHHGEVMQGVFYSSDGIVEHGLVTLPCPLFGSHARFSPLRAGPLTVDPANRLRARRAARLTLDVLGRTACGGELRLDSNVPLCWGCGSSTADVLAAIRATADAFEADLPPEWIARLAVAAETASDSLMYDTAHAVLFAQRRGSTLLDLGGPLPSLLVLGFNTEGQHGVDTLGLPPCQYSAWEIEAFRPLLGLLRRAVERQDAALVGRVATASTTIMQRHRPKRGMSHLLALAEEVGACGVQVAHSGTVAGLLFAPRHGAAAIERARAGLDVLGMSESWIFSTDGMPSPERVS